MGRKNIKNKIFVSGLAFVSAIGLFITSPLSINAENSVTTSAAGIDTVWVCGTPLGMRLKSHGLMITGYNSFMSEQEEYVNPAKSAGMDIGDRIVEINDCEICCPEDMEAALLDCGDNECKVTLERDESTLEVRLHPLKDYRSGEYKIGVWVKDSSAGIGTLTFYDEKTGFFGALGHGISESATHQLFPASGGDTFFAVISGVRKGCSGTPGELKGYFLEDKGPVGQIQYNCDNGIYGHIAKDAAPEAGGFEVPVDSDKSVHRGDAIIICTVSDSGPREYKIHIDDVDLKDDGNKGLSIHVTDEELLSVTGGIVQGM